MSTVETLVEAATTGNEHKVAECLREGLGVDQFAANGLVNAFLAAVFARDTKMVFFLIDKGAQVNVSDKNGRTALAIAIDQNNPEMFDLLTRHRANIHAMTSDGSTLLDLAYAKARVPMVRMLTSAGARRNR